MILVETGYQRFHNTIYPDAIKLWKLHPSTSRDIAKKSFLNTHLYVHINTDILMYLLFTLWFLSWLVTNFMNFPKNSCYFWRFFKLWVEFFSTSLNIEKLKGDSFFIPGGGRKRFIHKKAELLTFQHFFYERSLDYTLTIP